MIVFNYGRVCGECVYCKARDIETGSPLIPRICEVYCDCPEPPNYSGLVNPNANTFTEHCKYFKEKKNDYRGI